MPEGSMLQALLDEADDEVHVPYGTTYTLTAALLIDPGMSLRVDGEIVRAWDAADTRDAMFRNRDWETPVDGFQLYGRGTISGGDRDGKVVMVLGDDIVFNGVTVSDYQAGQAFYVAGDRMIFRRVIVRRSADTFGTGALRFCGGTRFRALDCDMESGDDVYQAVPANSLTDPLFGMATSDVRYRRCVGESRLGRFLIVFNDSNTTETITDVEFEDCVGTAANRGIVVRDIGDSSVSDVRFVDCAVTMADPPYIQQNQDVLIENVADVVFRRMTFAATGVWYTVTNSSGVVFDSCEFTGGTNPD